VAKVVKEHCPKSTNQNQRNPIGANSDFFNKICHKRKLGAVKTVLPHKQMARLHTYYFTYSMG